MAITEHSAAVNDSLDGSDVTYSYNFPSNGGNDILVVCISSETIDVITNVDWDNGGTPVALTKRIDVQGSDKGAGIWEIKNPTARGNLQIRIRTGGGHKMEVVTRGYAGVDATSSTDTDTGTNTPDISITSVASDSLCVDCLGSESGAVPTQDGGQTLILAGNGGIDFGTSSEPGGGTVAMGWTIDNGKKFAYVGLELTAVSTGFPHSQGYVIG